ncbi:peptidoglycan-binding protein [Kibdelosporangium lantanae]|uniref:Peptidoglycan-binding protein n=1 Tax=Kibdelosporangium lantanae TaxID=1497396 RepID=A0ABW3MDQ3_9PSEU
MRLLKMRAAVLAVLTATLTIVVGIAGSGTAMACAPNHDRSDELAAYMPQVNYGDHNYAVLSLQLELRQLGYDLQGTGTYADKTLDAVRDFQRYWGIKDSGIVGSKTWHALVGSLPRRYTGNGNTQEPWNFTLVPGEADESKVWDLKNAMQRIYPYSSDIPGPGNTYVPELVAQVRDFQRRVNIDANGVVDHQTLQAIYIVVSTHAGWSC